MIHDAKTAVTHFGFFLLVSTVATGQSLSLALSSASASPGATASVALNLNAPAGSAPAILEWSVNAPVPDVQTITATLGPAGAGKMLFCSANRCVLTGRNSSTIANGTVAVLMVQLSAGAQGNLALQFSDASATSATATSIGVTTVSGEVAVQTSLPIRVRCGGADYTDASGNLWRSDGSLQRSLTGAAIANTTTPVLYQAEAWSTAPLTYTFTVPNGSYNVLLKFAEFYFKAKGARVFKIVVNGTELYSAFDILANSAAKTALDVSIPVVVGNGQITIQFVPVVASAKIDAIQITTGT